MDQARYVGLSAVGVVLGGALLSAAMTSAPIRAAQDDSYTTAPCLDSEGPTTGFFCQPLSPKKSLIKACAKKKPKDLAACQVETVNNYCAGRSYNQVLAYNIDGQGNLAEVVCTRQVQSFASAPQAQSPSPAGDGNWQPLFDVNLLGYDRREFGLTRPDDWQSCKAACDADGECQAWTVSRETSMCYLKWDGNPELLSSNSCCITATKGMASAGAATGQKKVKTPEELKRLGRRTKDAAEDEVGRRAEEKIRRGLGKILGN